MGKNTPYLGLYEADPVADGKDTFNIDKMMNENWDKIDKFANENNLENVEERLTEIESEIKELDNKFTFDDYFNYPGGNYTEVKNSDGSWTTTLSIGEVKKAVRVEYPKNAQNKWVTEEKVFKDDGVTVKAQRTITEYKIGENWKTEVV